MKRYLAPIGIFLSLFFLLFTITCDAPKYVRYEQHQSFGEEVFDMIHTDIQIGFTESEKQHNLKVASKHKASLISALNTAFPEASLDDIDQALQNLEQFYDDGTLERLIDTGARLFSDMLADPAMINILAKIVSTAQDTDPDSLFNFLALTLEGDEKVLFGGISIRSNIF